MLLAFAEMVRLGMELLDLVKGDLVFMGEGPDWRNRCRWEEQGLARCWWI